MLRSLMPLAILSLSAGGAAAFGNDDHWVSGGGQGIVEATITSGPANRILVSCAMGTSMEVTGISFELAGREPDGRSVHMAFDGQAPKEYPLWDGSIISNCNACAGWFTVATDEFRKRNRVEVIAEDGRRATFSLKGANEAIGECQANYYR